MNQRPHNRLKLPFFALCAAAGVFFAIAGAVEGPVWWIPAGLAITAGCVYPIVLIRRGENPWWLRAPLDRKPPADRRDLRGR